MRRGILWGIDSHGPELENIEMLFAELRKDYSDYKGIIITHGIYLPLEIGRGYYHIYCLMEI